MRILLVKTSSLGDVIHNLPVATDIRRHIPDARIDWVVEEGFMDLPRLHPSVSRTIPVAIRRWRKALLSPSTWQEIGTFKQSLQSVRYDLVLDTQGLFKSALLTRTAHLAPEGHRCGHDRESAREPVAARFYDQGYAVPRDLHAVERNRRLAAAALGYAYDADTLDYGIAAAPLTADWLPPMPYAVLLTATSRDDKLWPEEHWIALGNALRTQGLAAVFPAGSARERERATRIAAAIPSAVVAPSMGLKALAALFSGARQVVGVDTGLTHLAAALHRPTVAIFTGSEPALTGVHAGPSAVNLGGRNLIPTMDEVLAALTELPAKQA